MLRIVFPVVSSLLLLSSSSAAQETSALKRATAVLTMISSVSSTLPDRSPFRARLDKPLTQDGQVMVPQGAIFEGEVRPVHARRLNRAGALRLVFQTVRLPDGTARKADISLTSIRGGSFKTDSEGTVRPHLSKKRLLITTGLSLLVGKIADDVSETALAALTAGTARYIGLGSGLAFFLLQKGREVKIPEGTEVEVTFNWDLQMPTATPGLVIPI